MEDPSSLPGIQKESPDPAVHSTYDYRLPRRLVVCLDGTWNQRDSGTNVYHLSNLVEEGRVKDEKTGIEWFQIVYYDEGVGTGFLNGISGGAFGIGLSDNVREAYDWLVEKYRSGDANLPPGRDDEIYIFGFSRGAFTARSLVGLIAKCGLLQRGAPIPPAQIWEAYRILGRHLNPQTNSLPAKTWMERIRGRPKPPFRLIRGLARDQWEDANAEPNIVEAVYRTEQLLLHWSRRVKIQCVGIFDTVGSMGLDALAIPWLRDKTAQFHDTYLSSVIVNGFHALAIDEHRANFPHIPWHRPAAVASDETKWGGTVKQHWFIGAHSNIGGGYEDNMLAQYPLAWMMQECSALGLQFRKPRGAALDPAVTPSPPYPDYTPLLEQITGQFGLANQGPQVRDSFGEIARGIWRGLIRSKREYRRIDPPAEFQNGVHVRSANEQVDESVARLINAEYQRPGAPRYNPPNLWEYWKRTGKPEGLPAPAQGYAGPRHKYFEGRSSYVWFFFWLFGVGAAAAAAIHFLGGRGWDWVVPAGIACVLAFTVDWTESILNHTVTLKPDGLQAEWRRAFITLFVADRIFILAAVLAGFGFWLVYLWPRLIAFDASSHVWWLFGLDAFILYVTAAAAWTAAPMADAGFGSILRLQFRATADGVWKCLDNWAGAGGDDKERRQRLMPVAHTIYRDMFGYIPAYFLTLIVGNRIAYLGLKPYADALPDPLSAIVLHWAMWSFWIVCAAALADYIEDLLHLVYIRIFPRKAPSLVVVIAFLATLTKTVAFMIGAAGFLAAIVWLIADQISRIIDAQAGALSVLAVLLTLVLFLPVLGNIWSKLRSEKQNVAA